MPIWLIKYGKYIVAVIALIALIFTIYNAGRTSGLNEGEVKYQKAVVEYQQEVIKIKDENNAELQRLLNKYTEAAVLFEKDLSELKTKEKIINNTVVKEVEKPVYNQCLVPDTGVKIHNDAVDTLNETRKK